MRKAGILALLVSLVLVVGAATTVTAKTSVIIVPRDYPTIQAAIDSAQPGDRILVQAGTYSGATVTKAVELVGAGAVIDSGPNTHPFLRAGFLLPPDYSGSGATIRGFKFAGAAQSGYVDDGKLDFPVFSRGANNVTVEHNVMVNSLQAITNWGGSGWNISHNEIDGLWTLNGGGIGIIIGDFNKKGASDSVVAHNKIAGTLHVAAIDAGGYNGTGVVLYADARWGRPGALAIKNNRVVQNAVSLSSDKPAVVDVAAIELTDTRDDPAAVPVIYDNSVGFNDLRGTALQIALTPDTLDQVNYISRNLGDNRGHGLHPSAFGLGGD